MAFFAQIEVRDPGGEVRSLTLPFPVTFGRDAGCDVTLGTADVNVSRVHAVMTVSGDQVILEDTSSNGTRLHQRTLSRGQRAQLSAHDTFTIGDSEVHIVVRQASAGGSASLLARIVGPNFREIRRVGLDGACLTATLRNGGLEFGVLPAASGMAAQSGDLLRLAETGGRVVLEVGGPDPRAPVTVNNYPPGDERMVVRELDTIGVGQHRIELISRNGSSMRCHNHSCRLLNEHQAEANCRWCGTRLSEALTVRVSS